MIFKKSYSLLVVPHDSDHGKTTFFHSKHLNIIFTLLAVAVLVSGFFITRHYLYHYKLKTAFEPTFKENEVLKEERKGYDHVKDSLAGDIVTLQDQLKKERSIYLSSVNGLARELDAVKKLAVKVKIQAGFKTSNIIEEGEAAGGPDDRTYVGWQDVNKPIEPQPLENKVRPGIAEQQQTLEELDAYLSTKESLVSDTPELAPLFGRMTSGFGVRRWRRSGHSENHAGLDIAVPKGTPVYSPAEAVVIFAGRKGDYGKLIELDHGNGYTTRFGHLSLIEVEIGDRVLKGQIIGAAGSTGRSTGPHLHYEVRYEGKAVDPLKYLGTMSEK
jgi:murein DD-endopeptidase MepM/ murein hydrolase activator NlpD